MTAFENVKGFRLRPIKFATITRFWSLKIRASIR
jgi:hypothetical protein